MKRLRVAEQKGRTWDIHDISECGIHYPGIVLPLDFFLTAENNLLVVHTTRSELLVVKKHQILTSLSILPPP